MTDIHPTVQQSSVEVWILGISATITFIAVMVALFQEKIKSFFDRAMLDADIKLESPDCHYIDLTFPNGQSIKVYYLRLRIRHTGGQTARNCEVFLKEVKKVSGNTSERTAFIPMNLVWSHYQPPKSNLTIRKGLFHHCDLGYITADENSSPIFKIDTIVQPNKVDGDSYPNILKTGDYVLTLIIAADNMQPLTVKYKVTFKDLVFDEGSVDQMIEVSKI